jgi:hypothetical protein
MALGPTKKDGEKSGRNTVKLFRQFLWDGLALSVPLNGA